MNSRIYTAADRQIEKVVAATAGLIAAGAALNYVVVNHPGLCAAVAAVAGVVGWIQARCK